MTFRLGILLASLLLVGCEVPEKYKSGDMMRFKLDGRTVQIIRRTSADDGAYVVRTLTPNGDITTLNVKEWEIEPLNANVPPQRFVEKEIQ